MALSDRSSESSNSSLSDFDQDDGTIFKQENGVKKQWAPGDHVHPLGSVDIFNAVGAFYGRINTVQAIWLNSKQLIDVEDIKTALWILSRQVPHLQFCFSRRGLRLWFRRMKKFNLDFETSTDDVMEVYKQMLETKYDLWKGPLWKVRMVIPNGNVRCGDSKGGFAIALIFSAHHAITDGTTNMKISREVVSILNQMSKGVLVTPKPVPLSPMIDEIPRGSTPLHYLVRRFVTKFHEILLKNFAVKLSFGGRLPTPSFKNGKTKVLFSDFTKNESSQLINKCKEFKVTVHSFIVAAANFALLKIAQSKSAVPLGRRTINVIHYINMRRYFSPEFKDSSGCHVSVITDKYKMTLPESQNFWEPAKEVHTSMKRHLEEKKGHLKDIPILKFASLMIPINHILMKNGLRTRTDCHYGTTNMGNLKDLLPEPAADDNIEITYLLRSVSSELADMPFLLTFHTFRDAFMISIDYYTNKMADETAEEFFATLCQFIRNLANFGTIYDLKASMEEELSGSTPQNVNASFEPC